MLLLSTQLVAQTLFREGKLIYKGDTLKRLQLHPAAYIPSKLVVYQKGELLRVEFWHADRQDSSNIRKEIQIRNSKGTYTFAEFSNSVVAKEANFALFTSYETEKHYNAEAALNGIDDFYRVDRAIQKVTWLDLPAEKVLLKRANKTELTEAILTTAIDLSLKLLITPLDKLLGTPLLFTLDIRGWQIQYTAISFESQPISTTLFEIDPNFSIMTIDPSSK